MASANYLQLFEGINPIFVENSPANHQQRKEPKITYIRPKIPLSDEDSIQLQGVIKHRNILFIQPSELPQPLFQMSL